VRSLSIRAKTIKQKTDFRVKFLCGFCKFFVKYLQLHLKVI